jgi:hypothetical protein
MRRPCFILILFVLLGFGLSLAVPAEDVPETAYDESETLPYESTSPVSILVPVGAARTTQVVPNSLHHKLVAPSPFSSARVRDTDANRSANARVSLALVCALRC